MRIWEVFESVDGCVHGEPYVLPHAPGEPAKGLVSGFYFWFTEPDEAGPEGPFNSSRAARQEMARMIDAIPKEARTAVQLARLIQDLREEKR